LLTLVLRSRIFSTLKMEAIRSSETSVQSTTSTRRHNPEDGILQGHRRENLKSYMDKICCRGGPYFQMALTKVYLPYLLETFLDCRLHLAKIRMRFVAMENNFALYRPLLFSLRILIRHFREHFPSMPKNFPLTCYKRLIRWLYICILYQPSDNRVIKSCSY
jgi:hypothetical protein